MLHAELTAVNIAAHKIPAAVMNRLDSSQAFLSLLIMRSIVRVTRGTSGVACDCKIWLLFWQFSHFALFIYLCTEYQRFRIFMCQMSYFPSSFFLVDPFHVVNSLLSYSSCFLKFRGLAFLLLLLLLLPVDQIPKCFVVTFLRSFFAREHTISNYHLFYSFNNLIKILVL